MDRTLIRGLVAGGLLVAASLFLPSEARAQRSGVEIWEANCGRCHVIQPTNKYEAKDWRSVGMHMAITARLTSAQRDAVIAFLVSGARVDQSAQAPRRTPSATGTLASVAGPAHALRARHQTAYLADQLVAAWVATRAQVDR